MHACISMVIIHLNGKLGRFDIFGAGNGEKEREREREKLGLGQTFEYCYCMT
jgi:hypothetical protein